MIFLYLDRSVSALKTSYEVFRAERPNAQRRTSLDQMCVQRLPLTKVLASRGILVLKEPDLGRNVCRNYTQGGSHGR